MVKLRDIIVEEVNGTCTSEERNVPSTFSYGGLRDEPTEHISSSKKFKIAYRTYFRERYGYLGPDNRLKILHCVTRDTRRFWSDSEDAYMRFKENLSGHGNDLRPQSSHAP